MMAKNVIFVAVIFWKKKKVGKTSYQHTLIKSTLCSLVAEVQNIIQLLESLWPHYTQPYLSFSLHNSNLNFPQDSIPSSLEYFTSWIKLREYHHVSFTSSFNQVVSNHSNYNVTLPFSTVNCFSLLFFS